MRNRVRNAISALAVAVAMSASGAQAGVVDSADVIIGGTPYRTFVDQTTGRTWLDLDNFWTPTASYNSVVAALAGSGFHIATLAELTLLQASIPAVPANFNAEAVIVGGNYVGKPLPGGVGDRGILWGIYEDGNPANGVSYAWKYDYATSWDAASNVIFGLLRTDNFGGPDLGVWVVSDTAETPLPAALPLFGSVLGLGAWLGARRRKKAAA